MNALIQAQRERAELEEAINWLRNMGDAAGRREAAIAEQHLARSLAQVKQRLTGELAENGGYVIYTCSTRRVFTGVASELWSGDLRLAERFFDRDAAEKRLRMLQAAVARRDRWKLSVEPLAKLQALYSKSHPETAATASAAQPSGDCA